MANAFTDGENVTAGVGKYKLDQQLRCNLDEDYLVKISSPWHNAIDSPSIHSSRHQQQPRHAFAPTSRVERPSTLHVFSPASQRKTAPALTASAAVRKAMFERSLQQRIGQQSTVAATATAAEGGDVCSESAAESTAEVC